MAFWNKWPYTNLQNLNLDWILNEIRKLKEEGVTLESLRADLTNLVGSNANTAKNADKLGDKAPAYYLPTVNMLDNSYFRKPINQRGSTLYTGDGDKPVYSIDRWYTWGVGATLTVNSDHVTIAGSPFIQNVPLSCFESGKTYTYAIKEKNGTLRIVNARYGSNAGGDALKIYLEWVGRSGIGYRVYIYPGEYEWAALYEGGYTADTLPPFVTPDPTLELVKCKSEYQIIGGKHKYSYIGIGVALSATRIRMGLHLSQEMRGAPSVHTYGNMMTVNQYLPITNIVFDTSGKDYFMVYLEVADGLIPGNAYMIIANDDTQARIEIECPL